jgi:hypothetical protein
MRHRPSDVGADDVRGNDDRKQYSSDRPKRTGSKHPNPHPNDRSTAKKRCPGADNWPEWSAHNADDRERNHRVGNCRGALSDERKAGHNNFARRDREFAREGVVISPQQRFDGHHHDGATRECESARTQEGRCQTTRFFIVVRLLTRHARDATSATQVHATTAGTTFSRGGNTDAHTTGIRRTKVTSSELSSVTSLPKMYRLKCNNLPRLPAVVNAIPAHH